MNSINGVNRRLTKKSEFWTGWHVDKKYHNKNPEIKKQSGKYRKDQ